jgi:hypothetical protein
VIGDRLTNIETGMTIPDWHVVPSEDGKDWSYQSDPYPFHDNPAFVEKIDNEFITVGEGGTLILDWAHTYNPATGEVTPNQVMYEGKEIAGPVNSMAQQIEIVRQRKAQILKDLGLPPDGELPESYRTESKTRAHQLILDQGYVPVGDVHLPIEYNASTFWWDSRIYVWNEATGKYDEESTGFYAYTSVGKDGAYGYVVLDNGEKSFVGRPGLNSFKFNATNNFSEYGFTPFHD